MCGGNATLYAAKQGSFERGPLCFAFSEANNNEWRHI